MPIAQSVQGIPGHHGTTRSAGTFGGTPAIVDLGGTPILTSESSAVSGCGIHTTPGQTKSRDKIDPCRAFTTDGLRYHSVDCYCFPLDRVWQNVVRFCACYTKIAFPPEDCTMCLGACLYRLPMFCCQSLSRPPGGSIVP